MSVTVTLHVFSGRPDPAWELTDDQSKELSARLARISKSTLLKPPGIIGGLGYRGFTINSVREKDLEPEMYIHAGIVDLARFGANLVSDAPDLEQWLLSTASQNVDARINQHVSQELSSGKISALAQQPAIMSIPPYTPGKWNNDPNIQHRNNCYNYANDKITNTFAQPGRGTGQSWTQLLSCANDVEPAAQRDGQVPVSTPATTPTQGHFIALVLGIGYDYHWYRLDDNGNWSHKPGQTPARNVDNSGRTITDPQNCDRGPYNIFCGFFKCIPANTRIN
ncbi:hypothetical protein ABC383_22670 [Noviherbaspirillum sp. 1P10PC]|uniref:hypothetical protein n=1 Tax=Noviherbaspirillum sp. 1P10PC TaxID=3132292 RepID=UPI0039A19A41